MITQPLTASPGDLSWSVAGNEPHGCTVRKTTALLNPQNSTLALSIPVSSNALNRAIVVIDAGFDAHWGFDLRWYFEKWSVGAELVVLDVGDGRTTTQTALALAVRLGELRVDRRREPLIAIGGGFLLDVVDLVATIFRRGAPDVWVPTTLRAQVRLTPCPAPIHVLVDTAFLTTLPRRHLADGLAAVLSVATLGDAHLFALLEANGPALLDSHLGTAPGDELVSRAIGAVLVPQGPDAECGDAFEMAFPRDMLQGESGATAIVISSWIAHRRGLIDAEDLHRVISTARGLEVPTCGPLIAPDLPAPARREAHAPRVGAQRLRLPVHIGTATFVDDVTSVEVLAACAAAEAGGR
jgi:3-dehydroquinate synthetase